MRRPDLLQAEHQLIAEHANIDAARAAKCPSISLTAALGTALSGLFGGGSCTYTGAPALAVPLFDGGRIRGNIRLAEANRQAALVTSERSIQIAFREVGDALAQRSTIDRHVIAWSQCARSARIAAQLSNARYRVGADAFRPTRNRARRASRSRV